MLDIKLLIAESEEGPVRWSLERDRMEGVMGKKHWKLRAAAIINRMDLIQILITSMVIQGYGPTRRPGQKEFLSWTPHFNKEAPFFVAVTKYLKKII